MNRNIDLDGLVQFAEKAGYQWRSFEGDSSWLPWEAEFALIGGDPNVYCFKDDEKYVIRNQERGSFSRPEIVSDHLDDIDKFLSFTLGNEVREKAGLPLIWLEPISLVIGEDFERFHVGGTPADVTLSWRDSNGARAVSGLGRLSASKFVRYSNFATEEIRASFLNVDGYPLFG